MKKLNITKKQYDESKYFTKKYGALKFVSESGKLYKTDKGVVLALESIEDIKDDDEGKKEDDAPKGDDADKGDEGGDSNEVTRGELTEMLKDVVADIETVCDKQDLSFEEVAGIEKQEDESDEEADKDEVIATKEEVADVLAGVIEKVTDIAEKNSVELPLEIEKKDDDEGAVTVDGDGDDEKSDIDKARDGELEIDEGNEEKVCPTCGAKMSVKKEGCAGGKCKKECGDAACECGDRPRFSESRKARAKLVREAVLRRARARKVRESRERRAKVRKVMESIRRRRAAKKVLESIRKRRAAKQVMESRKIRARRAGLAK